jgi:cysteine-rich repeat protein
MTVCGNGIVELPEACDDGNTSSGDYCAADCTSITGSCGDGIIQSNETCDDGMITMGCDTMQDGGDGKCLPAGMCSPGYVNVPGKGCQPALLTDHVHIMVDNFCNMSVMPMEYTVVAGQKLKLSYHNHSVDYPVDVWKSYGGGYTDLQPGMTWNETYEHCFGPAPSEEYADISTACSMFRLKIHCL